MQQSRRPEHDTRFPEVGWLEDGDDGLIRYLRLHPGSR